MNNKSFMITVLVLGLTIAAVAAIASREPPVVVSTNLENIPMQIGNYTATKDSFSEAVYRELNADKHVYRHYRSPDGGVIDLYIGYYGTAKGGRTGHNPYACLPGGGWAIVQDRTVSIDPSYTQGSEEVNFVVSQKDDRFNVMLHWYQTAGTKILSTGLEQNIQRFIGRVLRNRNDGAFVRISTLVAGKEAIDHAQDRLLAFSEKAIEFLPEYWPAEK
jgi:EpsI family protein